LLRNTSHRITFHFTPKHASWLRAYPSRRVASRQIFEKACTFPGGAAYWDTLLAGCGKTPERSRIPEAFACWGVLRGSPEGQM
jgi:hypothetical protein